MILIQDTFVLTEEDQFMIPVEQEQGFLKYKKIPCKYPIYCHMINLAETRIFNIIDYIIEKSKYLMDYDRRTELRIIEHLKKN